MQRQVGFIGLGQMGLPMVKSLSRNPDLAVLAFDTRDAPFADLAASDAWGQRLTRAGALRDLAACDCVITMLPDSGITSRVIEGDADAPGLAGILRPGSTVIDMGSSDPTETLRLAGDLQGRGIRLVDAPVSGSVAKATTGSLSIMTGCDAAVLKELRPVLEPMGTDIFATGTPGSAHALKALNNYVYAAGLLAVSEAAGIADRLGLDPDMLARVLNASSGRNVASETKLAQFIAPGTYNGGFALRLQAKDLATAARLRARAGVTAPQLDLCAGIWAEARDQLAEGADNTEIHRFVMARSGFPQAKKG